MNNDPRKSQDEMKLEQELAGLETEWKRTTRAEPPDLVDQAVLNTARRDLEAGRRRRSMRWIGGFATAAVVVLALTLVVEQDPRRTDAPVGSETSRLQKGAPEKQADKSVEVAPMQAPVQAPLPPAEPRPMAREARRDAARLKAVEEDAVATPPEAVPAQRFESSAAAAAPSADALEAEVADESPHETLAPDPETWIRELLDLQSKGETDALAAGIAAFRSTYPDYPLPAELTGRSP